MENFICNQYGERFAILNAENIKVRVDQSAICLRFLPRLQKI